MTREVKSHSQTKEKIKSMEGENKVVRDELEKTKKEHQTTRAVLEDKERFNSKAQEALKALADDLVSVRLQNEALRAEMEVQRKAFVLNVNWAARHTELKSKVDEVQQEYERLHMQQLQAKEQLDAAVGAQEGYMSSHREAVEELEKVRAQLAEQQDQLGLGGEMSGNIAEQLAELEILKRQMEVDAERKKKNKENAKKQLEKSLLIGDQGILRTVLGAWVTVTKNLKLQKE